MAIICKKKAEKSNMRDDLEAAKGVKKASVATTRCL